MFNFSHFLVIFLVGQVASQDCAFDDRQLDDLFGYNLWPEDDPSENKTGSSRYRRTAIEIKENQFSIPNTVKYRIVGDGANDPTKQALEEVLQEIQKNVRCLKFYATNTAPPQDTKNYVWNNAKNIVKMAFFEKIAENSSMYISKETLAKFKKEPTEEKFNKILNETNSSDLWSEYNGNKDWFEHLDKLNPEKILTIRIKNKAVGRTNSGDIFSWMRILTMDNNLNKNSTNNDTTIWKKLFMHEMFHVFGIAHTQRRNDRDDFIEVLTNHVLPEKRPQYEKCENCITFGKYECNSIMHYKQGDFGIPILPGLLLPTMAPKNVTACKTFGNTKPTEHDWISLRHHVGCPHGIEEQDSGSGEGSGNSEYDYEDYGSGDYGDYGSGDYGIYGSGDYGSSGSGDYGIYGSDDYGSYGAGDYGNYGSGDYGSYGSGDYGSSGSGDYGSSGSGDYGSYGSGDYGSYGSGEYGSYGSGDYGSSGSGDYGSYGCDDYEDYGSGDYGSYGYSDYGSSGDYGSYGSGDYGSYGYGDYEDYGSGDYEPK